MWRKANITRERRLTDEAVELRLENPRGMPAALPGQFIVLEIERDGIPMRASFSLSSITAEAWYLAVKQSRIGGVSEWLCRLEGTALVRLAGPFGRFTVNEAFGSHVLVAGGSGITPIYCLIQSLVESGQVPTLYYANASPDVVMFKSELEALDAAGKLKLINVMGDGVVGIMQRSHFENAAVYLCGPVEMAEAVKARLTAWGLNETQIAQETYRRKSHGGGSIRFGWQPAWGRNQSIESAADESVLTALIRSGVAVDSACLVGACKACEVRVKSGQVECNGALHSGGSTVTACTAHPASQSEVVFQPKRGLNRAQWFVAAVIVGLVFMGIWNVPPGLGMSSLGTMNTGHSSLKCESCHAPAEGTMRQQLSHNARTALGLHSHDWVPVGNAHVTNEACLACHDRPNDRHPVSRFQELRFASQRESIGVHACVNCHGEHTGMRVGKIGMDYCQHCHANTAVADDPLDVPHADLFAAGDWSTCLTCHDFHGNHMHQVPTRMAESLRESEVLDYFDGGKDPYGDEKRYTAKPLEE